MTTNTEALAARLDTIADDPMWADHSEISKRTALACAAELRRLSALCAELEAKAATWLASPEAAQRLEGYRELGRKCAELEAERDALRADALRYRWLRIALADKTDKGRSHWFCCIGSSDEFDAAIDAAMKGTQ